MAGAPLERTRWPGIYQRGDRWMYDWTDAAGKRRRGTAATRRDASPRKAAEEERAERGQVADAGPSGRLTFGAYAFDLFGADLDRESGAQAAPGRYQGRKGAVRDATRDEYRRDLERYWLPALGDRPLVKVAPSELARIVAELAAATVTTTSPTAPSAASSHRCRRCSRPRSKKATSQRTGRVTCGSHPA